MTRQSLGPSIQDADKITISTWVYIPKEAIDAQAKIAPTLDDHIAPAHVRQRIPIMEFGNSIEPFVGIHIGMDMWYEGYLGWVWWYGGAGVPFFPDYNCSFWIGAEDTSRSEWWPFGGGGRAYPSVDPYSMWGGFIAFNFFGTSVSGAGSAFAWAQGEVSAIVPAVRYNGFDDTGIKEFNVYNAASGNYYVPAKGGGRVEAIPITWTWQGELRVAGVFSSERISVKADDRCERSILVTSEIFFQQFWDSPYNYHMMPTPTNGPDSYNAIRVETGGAGKYFTFGDLVVLFEKLPNVTYGKPAIPSTMYLEGGTIKFLITGRWPEESTDADSEIVPTITFSAGGFVLDSWNHIFFTVDLTTMQLTNGQDDKEKMEWIDTLAGPMYVRVPLSPPYMSQPPKWAMLVNGKKASGDPVVKLTVYPHKGEHWQTTDQPGAGGGGGSGTGGSHSHISMALGTAALGGSGADVKGGIGFPIIEQEKGRWKTTGPNQNIMYAFTHIWFDKYIEPTKKNLNKFFWKSKNAAYNYVIPPPDKKAAVGPPTKNRKDVFGKPDVWFYRDKEGGVEWKNLGKMGSFSNTGTKPKDFRPGPGQPKRKKKTAET